MRCDNCGAPVGPEDRFCDQCGAQIGLVSAADIVDASDAAEHGAAQNGVQGSLQGTAQGAAQGGEVFCQSCGAPTESDMRFCQNCGTPLSIQSAAPSVDSNAPGSGESPFKTHRKGIIAGIAVVVVLAVVAALVVCFQLGRRSASNGAAAASASSSSAKSSSVSGASGSRSHGDKAANATVSCESMPSAEVESTDHSDSTLIATVEFSSSCDGAFKQRNVRIALKDGDDTVAAAVFDFSAKPLRFEDGEVTAKLAFSTSQYWRPYDLIDAYTTTVSVRAATSSEGKGSAGVHGTYGGANVEATEIEHYAQQALQWQVDHDELDINRFYDEPTTQLSSKKYGMEVDGKVWKYSDIYAQFLDLRSTWPNAVMLWASDYSYYTRNGHESDFYVVLSGETFDSKDAGKSWCSANHFGANDCMAIQLD